LISIRPVVGEFGRVVEAGQGLKAVVDSFNKLDDGAGSGPDVVPQNRIAAPFDAIIIAGGGFPRLPGHWHFLTRKKWTAPKI
jgi:hypothetical protein